MKAHFADIQGLRTRFFTAGSGAPLLLVHPVGYPSEIFARTMSGLADRVQMIAVDLPGQGFSDAPESWPIPAQVFMARHVIALAGHLGLERFSILGSSLGGLVAALVALEAPQRVDSLVLVGTGSVFNDPTTQSTVLEAVFANGSRAYRDPSLETLRSRFANTCFRAPPADDILVSHLSAYALPGALQRYRSIIDSLIGSALDRESTAYPRLEQLKMRTLVIVGEQDIRTSLAAHRDGCARMPDARLMSIADCGHLPFVEKPQEFNAAVGDFVTGAVSPVSAGKPLNVEVKSGAVS